ncbi:MAG: hypothetical protein ACMUIP_17475 [bacterium]
MRKIISLMIIIVFFWNSSFAMTHKESEPSTVKQLKKYYPHAQFYEVDWEEFQRARCFFKESKMIEAHNEVYAERKDMVVIYYSDKDFLLPKELMRKYSYMIFYAVGLHEFGQAQNFCTDLSSKEETLIKEELQTHYPRIKFCVMSTDAFQRLKPHLKAYRIIEYIENNDCSDMKPSPPPKDTSEQEYYYASDHSCLFNTHFSADSGCVLPDVPDDVAAVIYVVIGFVVVGVLIIYGAKYFYDVMTGTGDYDYWWEVGASSTFFKKGNDEEILGNGSMVGIKFASGIIDQNFRMGLSGEIGYLAVKLHSLFASKFIEIDGLYGIVGPAIRFCWGNINPHYISLEFLAGSSEHDEVGVISTARAGINWGIKEHIRLGINGGALYFNINETEGLFDKKSEFRFIGGIEVGYRF